MYQRGASCFSYDFSPAWPVCNSDLNLGISHKPVQLHIFLGKEVMHSHFPQNVFLVKPQVVNQILVIVKRMVYVRGVTLQLGFGPKRTNSLNQTLRRWI